MAYLTKCSLCGRDVSSECSSCPGCGHNVAFEMRQKEFEKLPIEDRIIGTWVSPDDSAYPLTINKDSTFIEWLFDCEEIRFRGHYSISGNKFNVVSCDPVGYMKDYVMAGFKMSSAKISLNGDTLLWTSEGSDTTDTYKRQSY